MTLKLILTMQILATVQLTPNWGQQLQTENDNLTWYFGNNAAIEFRNGVAYPSTWNGKTNTAAGMFWGKDGKPLLYMTRYYSYNAAGDTIRHNPPQLFNAPECMFVRKPGSLDTVYSFQSHQHDDELLNRDWVLLQEGAFTAHKFCLSGNGGKASVQLASDTLAMPFIDRKPIGKFAAASSLAVPNANGRDYWVVVPLIYPSELLVYRVTTEGIQKPPISFQSNQPFRHWWAETDADTGLRAGNDGTYSGEIKTSLDGRTIALSGGLRGRIIIYDFDPSSGTLSNEREISDSTLWQDDFFNKNKMAVEPYGIEFSPDGKHLYVTNTTYDINFIGNSVAKYSDSIQGALYQYDLTFPTATQIRDSRLTIVPLSLENPLGGLQLGPDGKIWVAQREKNYVSCIENPNARGLACGFKKVALTLPDSAICRLGFPVMPINMLSTNLNIGSIDACLGDTMHIPLYGSFISDSVVWDFDDPQSGASNTGYGKTGNHYYNTPGAYSVSATMFVGSEAQPTVLQWVYVHERPVAQASASHNPVCENDTVTLSSSGGVTARWYLDTALVAEGHDVTIRPPKPGMYTCIVETAFGCKDTTTLNIDTKPSPVVSVTGDTALCFGDRIYLTAHGALSYSWSSGPRDYRAVFADSTAFIYPEKSTRYFCTGINAVGCSTTVGYRVRVDQKPVLKTHGDATVCAATESIIGATGAMQYLWIDDAGDTITTDSNFFVYPRRTTTYTVIGSNGACSAEGFVTIKVLPGPQITIQGDSVLCGTGTATLTASGFDNIKWIDDNNNVLSAASTLVVAPTQTTRYRAVTAGDTTCADTAEHIVTVGRPPDISVNTDKSVVCTGDTVVLSATGAERYTWTDAAGNSIGTGESIAVVPQATSTYTVTATDSIGCSTSRSVSIQTIAPSSISFDVPDMVVDIAGGRITLPVQMHTPLPMIGTTVGPVRLLVTTMRKALYIDSIVGMSAVQSTPPSPDQQSYELYIDTITISAVEQTIATIHALPLVDADSVSSIDVALLELGGVPICEQDSSNTGELTITGCGRRLHGGITIVQPTTLNVYPNPIDDILNIDIESGIPGAHALTIVDELGRVLYEKHFEAALHGIVHVSERIPASTLSSGFMCVRLQTPVETQVRSVAKVH